MRRAAPRKRASSDCAMASLTVFSQRGAGRPALGEFRHDHPVSWPSSRCAGDEKAPPQPASPLRPAAHGSRRDTCGSRRAVSPTKCHASEGRCGG
jgi:hypothetical protein